MIINMQEVLLNLGGKPFVREEFASPSGDGSSSLVPLRLGDALIEGLMQPDRTQRRDAKENIRRSRLAEAIFDALGNDSGTITVTNEDQRLLLDAVNSYLAHPRAVAEAIRLIDPAQYGE